MGRTFKKFSFDQKVSDLKKKNDLSLFPKRKTLKIAEALKFKFII